MDELVELVMKKTGLGKAQAKQVVETVIGFLKQKLPDPIAAQVDGVLGNEQLMDAAEDVLERGLGGLGGLLSGGKK